MKILQLAPHPFYIDRGTPIDVLLVLKVLSSRQSTLVDIIVFPEGREVKLPNVRIFRTPNWRIFKGMRPGFSFKKIICDCFLFLKALSLIRKNNYDLIHAGEESVFFAMIFKKLYKIPYLYDLDSSLAQQLVEKRPSLKILSPLFNWLEALAIRGSRVNLPVCNELATLCNKSGSRKTVTLHDISQITPFRAPSGILKRELRSKNPILLYAGNLEAYQGIDLLLESFVHVIRKGHSINLVLIGGTPKDIAHYKQKAKIIGLNGNVYFLGPRPVERLGEYLSDADIIACPRIKGINTPMKLFPFLHSGKAVIATDLLTHNQIITRNEAYLSPPNPESFAAGILKLLKDEFFRKQLGQNGQAFVEKNHTFAAHQNRLNSIYDWLEKENNIKS